MSKKSEASLALYRWMEHTTKALTTATGTLRTKFFKEQVEAVRRAWEDFQRSVK